MSAEKTFAVHATRTYFVKGLDEEEALDAFFNNEYYDKSDEDVEIEEWKE